MYLEFQKRSAVGVGSGWQETKNLLPKFMSGNNDNIIDHYS